MDKKDNVEKPRIHWTLALIPLAVLVALQVLVIREFGSDALDGASQTALLVAAAVAVSIGMVLFKVPWKSIDHGSRQFIEIHYKQQINFFLTSINVLPCEQKAMKVVCVAKAC